MANPELELISNVLKSGDLRLLKKRGITPAFFRTSEAAEYFKWIWGEHHNPSTKGEVPTTERMLRKFPDFDYCPTRDSVAALVSELSRGALAQDLDQLSNEIQELLDDSSDPSLVLHSASAKMRDLATQNAEFTGIHMKDAYALLIQEYETIEEAGGITGLPFPWAPLNRATGGMHPENFIVIYGRPKNMKTWLGLLIATWVYLFANARVFIFSKEMTQIDMTRRCASIITGVPYAKVKKGTLAPEDREAYFHCLQMLNDWELETEEGGHRTADWKNITHISQDLKSMGQYLEVPVLGTTQANRANAKAPSNDMDDLSFADSIGMDADLLMRAFKGPHPSGKGLGIALYFPGIREAIIDPFLINARPGGDFEVFQESVDMKAFLKSKQKMDGKDGSDDKKASPALPRGSNKGKKAYR